MDGAYFLFNPGRAAEAFYLIQSSPGSDLEGAASEVLSRLQSAFSETGSSAARAMMTRVYLRGGARARDAFCSTPLYREISQGPVSIVGQNPLEGGPVALFSQHIISAENIARVCLPSAGKEAAPAGISLQGNYHQLWLSHPDFPGVAEDISVQTTDCLGVWNQTLNALGMNWAEHVLRTWFFIHDIDRNYAGMVRARQDFFAKQGLAPTQRFPASTGIGAQVIGKGPKLAAELQAFKGLSTGQIQAMRDEKCMPPAMSYGVAFERGIKVRFGDRVHCHISGTASIDKRGGILHPGNVDRQTEQALENVKSLLATEGLGTSDLAYLLAYVREGTSAPKVRARLQKCLPGGVPFLILEGAVCRPGWLVEVEGLAIKAETGPFKDFP